MTSIKDVLAAAKDPAKRRTAVASILLDGELVLRHQAADEAFREAMAETLDEISRPDHVKVLEDELRAVEAEIEAAKVDFRFRAVGSRVWFDLLAAHPPTKEQVKARPNLDHNPDTFMAAVMAESCVDPEMTVEDATELLGEVHPSQRDELWGTCVGLNRGDAGIPKSAALGLARLLSGASDGPVTRSGSRGRSSSAG